MKKLLFLFSILSVFLVSAQTPVSPTAFNNVKIVSPVLGAKTDSVMVWRGSGDKILRYLPLSVVGGSGTAVKEGKITITDLQGQAFTNLATAISWITPYYVGYLTTDITDASFNAGVFKLTVPENSSLAGSVNFCSGNISNSIVKFEDKFGLITVFSDYAFQYNSQNNIFEEGFNPTFFGNHSFSNSTGNNTIRLANFGDNCFQNVNPAINNTIGKIKQCGTGFGLNYTGRLDFKRPGDNGTQNLPTDFFTTANFAYINTDYANKFIDAGNPDADLVQAKANMTNANSIINYEGIDGGSPYTYKYTDFTAENGGHYIVAEGTGVITDPSGTFGQGYIVYSQYNTITVGGITYPQFSLIYRFYNELISEWITNLINKPTNLSYEANASFGLIINSNGANAQLLLADETNAGLLKPSKFTVLENTNGSNNGDNAPNTNANEYANGLNANKADINSPTFTGVPNAPTATTNTNTTQIANTSYVVNTLDAYRTVINSAIDLKENTSNKQTDLTASATKFPTVNAVNTGLGLKQATLVSGGNIVTINNQPILGSGNITIAGGVVPNTAITGATKTKITYDSKGLVTAGVDATTADITDSANKRYVTDAQLVVLGNTANSNNGDNSVNTNSNTYTDNSVATKANINSPTLTGIPAGPTATTGTSTTQLATTAFVLANIDNYQQYKTANFTAQNGVNYVLQGSSLSVSDPSSTITGKGYSVYIISGVSNTVGSFTSDTYNVGSLVYRTWNGSAWVSKDIASMYEIGFLTSSVNTLTATKVDKNQNGSDFTSVKTLRANIGIENISNAGNADFTILSTAKVVITNIAITLPRNWTLPLANTFNPGQELIVADLFGTITSTNTITVLRSGTDLINNSTSLVIGAVNGMRRLISDGISKWTFDAGVMRISDYIGTALVSNNIVGTDTNGKLITLPVSTYPSLAELAFTKGLTSSAQIQINTKSPIISPTFTGKVSLTGSTAVLSEILVDLSQTWNTTGSPTAIKLNVTNNASGSGALLMDLQTAGASVFNVTKAGQITTAFGLFFGNTTNTTGIAPSDGGGTAQIGGKSLRFYNGLTTEAGAGFTFRSGQSSIGRSNTSGIASLMDLSEGFAPTSGNGIYNVLNINGVFNQTGVASGITRGLYVNPTLTAAADYRAIEAVTGSIVLPYATASTTYAIKTSDYLLNFTGMTYTATLPTAVGCTGKTYVLKNRGTGIVTIATTSSQTIDNVTSMLLSTQNSTITVVSTGANWIVKVNNQNTFNDATSSVQTQLNVKVDQGVNNATTTVLTSAQLTTAYPSATVGFRVYCTSIIAGSMTYERTPTQWIGTTVFTP